MHHTISQKVAEIFDLYTELHDIRITLFGPDGSLIYPDQVGRPNCLHCTMLRDTLGMDSQCRELDHKMMQVAFEREDMITYTCHAGMREATTPLIVDDKLAGYIMLGQFRSDAAPDQSPYAELWEKKKGTDKLQQAYEQTAVFPENKIETLLSMFRHLVEFIIEGELIHHKDYDLIQPVIARIQDHPEQSMSLGQASRLIGRSPSTVTRLFKKLTDRSFKQYQVYSRMQQASAQLRISITRPISEVASSVGYEDSLYFSRMFRREFGMSPSEYRSQAPQKVESAT